MVRQASRLLSSPRRRRRLIILLVVLVVAAVVAVLVTYEGNTAAPIKTPETKGKPFLPAPQPKNVKFTKAEASAVLPVAMKFVRDAVGRADMHSAWDISAPAIRSDTSRKDWDHGENTTIAPFPLHHARWRLDYNYRSAVGLEVAVFPKEHADIKNPMVYYMELAKQRRHGHTAWLVDQWVPAPGSAQVVQGGGNSLAADQSTAPPQGLGSVWLLAPVGVLALGLSIPLLIGIREWRRSRRARRRYEGSPSLPSLSEYRSGRSQS
jgi:hypothetical protein